MIGVLVFGGGAGAGLWLIWHALTARPTLSGIAATLARPGRAVRTVQGPVADAMERRLAHRALRLSVALGLDPARRATDLRITHRAAEQHALITAAWATAGASLGLLVAGGLFHVGALPAVLIAAALAAGGVLVEERALTVRAREARSAFRHAFGAYLDLVTVMEAAGAGPETALARAAEAGDGWAFAELRMALAVAQQARRSTWDALAQLGADIDITELSELAASVALVEHEGARIRHTIEAKADSMRAEQLHAVKADAASTTEKMTLPVVVLLMAFLVFIAYPAAARISEVGHP